MLSLLFCCVMAAGTSSVIDLHALLTHHKASKKFYQNHKAGQPRLWKYRIRGDERAKRHDEGVSGSKLGTETEVKKRDEHSRGGRKQRFFH